MPDRRRPILVGLLLTLGLGAMDSTIVATAIPSIVHDLGGFSLFAWVFSVYLLTTAVATPVYGKLSDLYGRKPVLFAGVLLFLAGSVLCGFSWNMVTLIAFRGLQGFGAGSIQPVANTIVGDIYSVEERARIQGILSGVWGVSAVVGPAIGGLFSQYLTWRAIFYINVPIGFFALVMVGRHLHEQVERRRHDIDGVGAALLLGGMGLLILGLLEGGVQWSWTSWASLGVFAAAAVLLGGFVVQEGRASEPIIPGWVFARRVLLGANVGAAILGVVVIGLTTFLPTFDQGVLGASAVVAGFSLAAMSVGWPVMSSLSGRLYLRVGFRTTALVGAVVALVAALAFVAMPASLSVGWTAASSFGMGLGLGLLSTPTMVGVQSIVGWSRRGVVTGAYMFSRNIGSAVGAAIFGAIVNGALAGWLRHAPASLSGHLPPSVSAASAVLGSGSHLPPAAAEYVRRGLYLGVHRVYLGLAAAAVVGIAALAVTPRRWRRLRFAGDPEPVEEHTSGSVTPDGVAVVVPVDPSAGAPPPPA